jgi:hypothetical protein
VAMLGAPGTARAGVTHESTDGHDWPEVTPLTPAEPEPVDELVAPELVDPVELALVAPELVEPVELVVAVAVAGVAACVTALRASAGSCPVTNTTVMSIHTAKNSAIDPPITRARILRTRARRASLSLSPSFLVMSAESGRAIAGPCEPRKKSVGAATGSPQGVVTDAAPSSNRQPLK